MYGRNADVLYAKRQQNCGSANCSYDTAIEVSFDLALDEWFKEERKLTMRQTLGTCLGCVVSLPDGRYSRAAIL